MTTSTISLNIELIDGAAQTAETYSPNIELIDGTAQTAKTFVPNIELIDGAADSVTRSINIELLEDIVQAGQPEVILNLVGVQAGRLRAELFDWQVNLRAQTRPISNILYDSYLIVRAQSYVDEFIGAKNGDGPVYGFSQFEWTWTLDGVGSWSATLPAMTPAIEKALNGTSQIIKFYVEGIGHIFTGWISEHEISEDGNLTLLGYDLSITMARRSSFYRHEFENGYGHQMYQWAAGQLIPSTYELTFGPNSGSEGQGFPSYPVTIRFQSQTVVEMFTHLNMIWGIHWRINPVRGEIYIDQMGTDSGKIISTMQEDDPKALEEGVLVVSSIRYGKTDDEIINSELAQGSNNAFGVSVELRHSDRQDKFGYYSGVHWSEVTFPQYGRIDEIRGFGVDADDDGIYPTNGVSFELGRAAATAAPEAAENVRTFSAYAVQRTFSDEYDLAWVAAFGYKQIYDYRGHISANHLSLYLCPDSGGQPDTANPIVAMPMGNYPSMGEIPEVNEVTIDPDGFVHEGDRADFDNFTNAFTPGNDKVNFSEVIWFPDQINGFQRLPAGSYWFVVTLTETGKRGSAAWNPTVQFTGYETWVAGGSDGSPGQSALWYDYDSDTWVSQSGFRPFLEISGRYNNAASIANYPYIIMGQYAAGIDNTRPTTGQRIFYLRNNTSIQNYGLREKVVTFQNAVDSREGIRDITESANVLYGSAVVHIDRHLNLFELIGFEVIGGGFDLPKPGEKVRVVHRGVAEVEGGASEGQDRKYVWVDIDALYWVLSINIRLTDEGISYNFSVASVPENLLDENAIPFEVRRAVFRHNNYMSEIEYGQHVGIIQEDF